MKKVIVSGVLMCMVAACLPGLVLAQYKEAPMLAELVAAGKLPPVEERLPVNPVVIEVFEEIGQYGGNVRRAYSGIADRWGPTQLLEEFLTKFVLQQDGSVKLELNWVDEMTPNADSSEWTFHIREGLRWSDGELVTTDDVRFWYEDYVLREDLFGAPFFDVFKPGGVHMEMELVDDLTFVAKFPNPYPLFPARLAGYTQSAMLPVLPFIMPEHYLRQFHPDFAPEGFLDEQVEKYGVNDWKSLWFDRGPVASWWLNPELPTISPWMIDEPAPAAQVTMVRNPYYFAVDAEGNQLPYIDTMTHDLFQDKETLNLWVVQGLIDMQKRHIDTSGNYTLFKENEEKGGYVMIRTISTGNTTIVFNLNYPDEAYRKVFQDIRFREAVSVAINREEYVDIILNGLSEPRQASPISSNEFFVAELETKWIEFDPDRANALLDEVGLDVRDSEGFRLLPNGERMKLVYTVGKADPGSELLVAYLEDVGLDVVLNVADRTLTESMAGSNELMMSPGAFGGGLIETGAGERYYTSTGTNDRGWAPLWGRWYGSRGDRGEEPPADHPVRTLWAAWDAAQTAATLEEAKGHIQEMVNVFGENQWIIGIHGEQTSFTIVNKNLGNVPDEYPYGNLFRVEGFTRPAQWLFRQ